MSSSDGGEGILARVALSPIVARGREAKLFQSSTGKAVEGAVVVKKLLQSTGKAAWIAGTTFVVVVFPLLIEMDREQQMNDLELHQASILGTPALAR